MCGIPTLDNGEQKSLFDPFSATHRRGVATFAVLMLFCVAGSMSLFGCRCTAHRGGDATSPRVEREPTADSDVHPGTVLRIVCDIPDDVGPIARTYPGRIDWPGSSESFSFNLSQETFDVPLKSVITVEKPVRVFFIVDEEPPCPTKFSRGEWSYRGRPCRDINASHANAYRIRLSRFRDAYSFPPSIPP